MLRDVSVPQKDRDVARPFNGRWSAAAMALFLTTPLFIALIAAFTMSHIAMELPFGSPDTIIIVANAVLLLLLVSPWVFVAWVIYHTILFYRKMPSLFVSGPLLAIGVAACLFTPHAVRWMFS